MVSESDSDMVISKRPKTKPKMGKELTNISDSEEHKDNVIQDRKKDNSAYCKNVKEKKAIKRTRESEEESSITSDDEALSTKRIRKNSDDRCVSFRPKKVVSDAARRRREAVKTVREKKMAALETDSESDSDDVSEFRLINSQTIQDEVESSSGNKSEDDSVSKAKQHSDFEDEKVARNPKSLINSVKNRKSQREKISKKSYAKNEESSSAYNSDSENGEKSKESSENIRFQVEEKKSNSENTSPKFPKRKTSLSNPKKSGKCVDSGSDVDNGNHKHTTTECLQKKSLKKCDESEKSKCELDTVQNDKHCVRTSKSDDEQNSSTGDSDDDRNVSKEAKVKLKGQNTLSSCDGNSSDEENINKKNTREQKKIKKSKKSLTKKQFLQCESSSDSDRPFKKTESVKKNDLLGKGELKLSQRNKSDSSSEDDISNNDHPVKNTKRQQKDIQRKGNTSKQSLKIQNSSQEESFSENEHPSKKTKSSTKAQNYSDSEKSDSSFDLKSQNMSKSMKNDSECSDSDTENCKPSYKTKSLKYNKTQLKPKITGHKKGSSDSSGPEGESRQVKEKKICEKVLGKIEGSKETRNSTVLSDEAVDSRNGSDLTRKKTKVKVNSSDDSDSTPKKSVESKDKVIQRKSDVKIESKAMQKTSDESELSDFKSENNSGKKQMKNNANKPREVKKELSESETSSGEQKSKNKLNKSVEVSKTVKKEQISSDSDSTGELSKQKIKHEISDSADTSDSEDNVKNLKGTGNKTVKTKETDKKKSSSSDNDSDSSKIDSKRKKKALGKMEARINNLKKYVRACGIFINNFTTFWEGCKSDKQKADKLSKVLVDFGVKGRPSLQQCTKLRKKAERKREVEELDLSNIIDTEENGRSRCRSSRTYSIEKKPSQVHEEEKAAERAADWKQRFSRIKDLVDSDSSSS